MKSPFFTVFAAVALSALSAQSAQANNNTGLIPGVLSWTLESITEQWTETSNPESAIYQEYLFPSKTDSDNPYAKISVDKRFNRRLVFEVMFTNYTSENLVYEKDSTLEILLEGEALGDAVPAARKTILPRDGKRKLCKFVMDLKNKLLTDKYDIRNANADVSINPVSGSLLIENKQGVSILDETQAPSRLVLSSPSEAYGKISIAIFLKTGDTLKYINLLKSLNEFFRKDRGNNADMFTFKEDSIVEIAGNPIVVSPESTHFVLIQLNKAPVFVKQYDEFLQKEVTPGAVLDLGLVDREYLNNFISVEDYSAQFNERFDSQLEALASELGLSKFYKGIKITEIEDNVKYLKNLGEQGDEDAIEALSYYNGKSLLFNDYQDAFEWFSKRAEKGSSSAELTLGRYYKFGFGVEENLSEALKWYKKVAEKGNADAMTYYAVTLLYDKEKNNNREEALNWLRKAAEKDVDQAYYFLALALFDSGKKSDRIEGIEFLKKSVEKGNPDSMYLLGIEYYCGVNIPRDGIQAFQLFQQAADNGIAEAKCRLGTMYMHGIGVQSDPVEAAKCFHEAAEKDVPEAQYYWGLHLIEGMGVKRDISEGIKWVKKAADNNYADAQWKMGTFYSDGLGVKRDINQAVRLYQKSADGGCSDGQLEIGRCYYIGLVYKKDYEKAFEWMEKAALQNNALAMVIIGDFYRHGEGTDENPEQAAKWYKKAADEKYPNGIFKWGYVLYHGCGVKKDAKAGLIFIKKAAKLEDEDAINFLKDLAEDKEAVL